MSFYPIENQFRESFCDMDIAKINLVLEINRKFCKVSKLEFIAALSKMFDYLKLLGENSFDCYTAKCASNVCCNCNKDVFVFSSKNLKYYIALMIEGDGERIYQISECYNYDFNSSRLNIRLKLQEFVNPNWEKIQYDINEEMIKELYPTADYVPSFSEFSLWDEKMSKVRSKKNHTLLRKLVDFYRCLLILFERISNVDVALEEYKKLNLHDEASVILWLINNEQLNDDVSLYSVPFELDPSTNYLYSISNDGKHLFDLSEICGVPVFEELYNKLYMPFYEKFDIEKHFFKFSHTPLKNRLIELEIVINTEDYNFVYDDNVYEIDLEKLKAFNIALKNNIKGG